MSKSNQDKAFRGKVTEIPIDQIKGPHTEVQQHELAQAETMSGAKLAEEIGGPKGLEPTRYGDWERNGRCYDF